MKQRIITALIMGAVFIPVVYVGGWLLSIIIALLAIIGLFELFKMKGNTIFSAEGLVSAISLIGFIFTSELINFLPQGFSSETFIYLATVVLLVCTVFSKNHFSFDDAAVSVLGILYIGIGFRSLLETRESGLGLLILVLITIWATDIFAYLIGRKIGKRKLAPNISPNKTIEGSVGGTLAAVLIAALYLYFAPISMPFVGSLILMLLLSMAGQLGDLVESAFKRHYGIKDSGNIFPGHGGVLDRFDSMLFVFPILSIVGLI
ncbi:phosphatidate cytidylyltransferase [Desemzia sp. RIT804]|uniref:phosphatidate cytidylyltransferase n=1 Tax=Desemzia sp. RIT 804 TaxID=2810209 RepID=UPI00195151F7|nr:phosphatidate cytidylyltransferase [Desemzia sp. RIT 804]